MSSVLVSERTQRVLIAAFWLLVAYFTLAFSWTVMKMPLWGAGLLTGGVSLLYAFLLGRVRLSGATTVFRCLDIIAGSFLKAFLPPFLMAVVFLAVYAFGSTSSTASIAGIVAVVVAAWILFPGSVPQAVEQMVRGRARPVETSESRAAQVDLPKGDAGITWGGLRIPSSAATSHFMVVGTTGSGKTITLRLLMQEVLLSIGTGADHRALIYDAKQDLVSQLAGMGLSCKVKTLNPFDERCVAWDIAADITEPTAALQAAVTLLPQDPGASQPFFVDAAQSLLYGVIVAFIVRGSDWRFSDLVRAMRDPERLKRILNSTEDTSHIVQRVCGDRDSFNNIMATVATKMLPYEAIAAMWDQAGSVVSLRDWVRDRREDNYVLVLGNSETSRKALDALNRVVFKRVTELLLDQAEDRAGGRRTWVFLDELAEAGRLEGLSSLLAKGRSKGTSVVIGFQDIDGLRVVYGNEETNALTGQCNNKAILRLESPATAEWASKLFGSYEAVELRKTETKGKSTRGDVPFAHDTSSSIAYAENYVKRESVLESEFSLLPTTSRANGLSGYYIVPTVGTYKHTYPGSWLFAEDGRALAEPVSDVPDLVRRSKRRDQFLQPWAEEDFQRLKFPELGQMPVEASATEAADFAAHMPRSSRRP